MANQERMPFGGDEPIIPPKSQGLKISNKNSKFTKAADDQNNFEQLAGDLIAQKNERNKKALELAGQFISSLKDKTLIQNKSELAKNIEKDTCGKLIKLSLEINNDGSELEGMGSTAIINLLLKTTLLQRDIINELDYKISRLEKNIQSSSEKK